jgi:hypothetical protein
MLRQVLQTLIASQIINLSCIIRMVIMIATTIGVYNTINDTMLEKNIEPYIANAQSTCHCHHFILSCATTSYCENTALNLSQVQF